jgi:multicomponent Na+:H+ antiporter subunit A
LPAETDTGKFYAYLHGFLLAMLGLVMADNLLAVFVFWEMTTLISYLLIGFECESEAARQNARQALLVTGAGGLALLVGFLLLGTIADTYELPHIYLQSDMIKTDPLYLAVLVLIFSGAFTKSAQFPFHFWLPNAMTAPTPISAFLHSATMVKAGIYLLARLHPILGGTFAWMIILVITGGITALLGSVLAMRATDLKRILAYTTIMALGILTMFLGGRTTPALTAAMTFLMVHSLYKCALFYAELGITLRALAAISFLLLTAPVAAHLIGRAAYYSGIRLWHKTWIDQLKDRFMAGDLPKDNGP